MYPTCFRIGLSTHIFVNWFLGTMRKIWVVLLVQVCFETFVFSQSKRGNVGVFGFYGPIALDFNSQPPSVTLLPGQSLTNFTSDEGCASICDANGNLLFYTNGPAVWNKQHQIMPNGGSLMGYDWTTTTTQVVIVPIPKDPFRYYIVSALYQGRNLVYSLVDMRLNKGLGDVVFKNQLLYNSSTEKVCVVKHSSGEALWLVTHVYGSNEFKVFPVNENGINLEPVTSAVGISHALNIEPFPGGFNVPGTNAIGYMKPSHDGNMIAVVIEGQINSLELFRFDRTTGQVSDPMTLFDLPADDISYGVEFSPDNTKLYLSASESVYQFNLLAGTREQITSSATVVGSANRMVGALQLGPDGKIYCVGRILTDSLDVIDAPNASGTQCQYVKNKISLKGGSVRLGLPEFIYDTVEPEITYTQYCNGDAIQFNFTKIQNFKTIIWNFGDDLSGADNFSNETTPTHIYENQGNYEVKVTVTLEDQSTYSYSQMVSIFQSPEVTLGNDTIKCRNTAIQLQPTTASAYLEIKWSDGSTGSSLTATKSGRYWVRVSDQICSSADTIEITDLPPPEFTLEDTTLCKHQILDIYLNPGYTYEWSDGIKGAERHIGAPGNYSVIGRNRCEHKEQKMKVDFLEKLQLSFKPDTLLCAGQTIVLDATNSKPAQYRWQDGSSESSYTVREKGSYWVEVFHRCEFLSDTIHVNYVNEQPYFIPNVITPNNDGFNDAFIIDEMLKSSSLQIFSRWGELIHSSGHYENDWQADNVASGIYYYSIHDSCANSTLKGTLHVLK
jgi:gliding motility-associated-like protein